jgi:hypothetical protein
MARIRADVELRLEDLADRGRVLVKACAFDHDHVACTSTVLLEERDGAVWKHTVQSYNGRISRKQVNVLLPEHGRMVEDPDKEVARLLKRGCIIANLLAPEREEATGKAGRGRPRKRAAAPAAEAAPRVRKAR